ncbi:MAG: portal protein, partial [Dehalococcoidia bacterium]|nr:portal protein [Dehalococcoidia bacterium]
MEIKINVPLIDRITAALAKFSGPLRRREDTTETSLEAGIASFYYQMIKLERTRLAKYADYELMDEEYPEISTALDLYADNATKEKGEEGNVIDVVSKNSRVQNIIEELMDRTNIEDLLWDTARQLAKFGDEFDELVADDSGDVDRLKNLPVKTMFRDVDEFGRERDKPYIQKDEGGIAVIAHFERWQIVHWKNGGQKKMYGDSVMRAIRRVYKQLQLMEDGMVIGRLTRSHLRYKFLIDVEGMNKEEREDHIKKVKDMFKKKRLMN